MNFETQCRAAGLDISATCSSERWKVQSCRFLVHYYKSVAHGVLLVLSVVVAAGGTKLTI